MRFRRGLLSAGAHQNSAPAGRPGRSRSARSIGETYFCRLNFIGSILKKISVFRTAVVINSLFFIALAAAFFLQGCASNRSLKSGALSPPGWVNNIPVEEGRIFAVGSCGRTYYKDDAWRNAADNARGELAKNLQARIQNAFLAVQSSDGSNWALNESVVEATSSATDVVMKESQIVSIWYDENGALPGGEPGTTYALAVLSLRNAAEKLKLKVDNKVTPDEYEKIREAISGEQSKPLPPR